MQISSNPDDAQLSLVFTGIRQVGLSMQLNSLGGRRASFGTPGAVHPTPRTNNYKPLQAGKVSAHGQADFTRQSYARLNM